MLRSILIATAALVLIVGCAKKTESGDATPKTPDTPATAPGGSSAIESAVQLASFNGKKVEVGCGMCIYDIPGAKGCTPAIMVDGKPMLVKVADLDLHEHGLCTKASEAVVSAKVENGTLVVTEMEMVDGS